MPKEALRELGAVKGMAVCHALTWNYQVIQLEYHKGISSTEV
jgi:hypothetical protein